MILTVYMLVCLSSCTVPNVGTGAMETVGAGYVGDRILWDGAPYTPPAGWEIKPDDGTPIGGTTTP